jgi:membrane-anchored protein YejM (alkaline phosphatase superfamily)
MGTLWTQVALGTLAVLLVQWFLWNRIHGRALRTREAGPSQGRSPRRWFARPKVLAAAALLALVAGEKSVYAWADLTRDRNITARSRLMPLYQPLTIKDLLGKRLGFDLSGRERVKIASEGVLIRYPLETPRIPADSQKPNILVVVIDSLRRDVMVPEVMPRLARWSEGARRFRQHLSGGNATRFGVFSLVYGLHGSYWMPILNEQAPPVLVTALVEAGYEPRVISAASMNSPEFRSTCWVSVEDSVHDRFEGEKYLRDRAVAADFRQWIATRDASRPFFAFALIDSPHQVYSVDPELTPFTPYEQRLDYLKLGGVPSAEMIQNVKNRYLNACAAADVAVAGMLEELEARGLAQNTLVVVTGDHGEEFYEHGYLRAHLELHARPDAGSAFAMRGPGRHGGRRELLPTSPGPGADAARAAGRRIAACARELQHRRESARSARAAPAGHRRGVAGGSRSVLEEAILLIPLEGHKGLVEPYSYDWKPLDLVPSAIPGAREALAQLSLECRRFLR